MARSAVGETRRRRAALDHCPGVATVKADTGLRPDEIRRLQFRDGEIVDDEWSGERILEIKVHGKRGEGWCKSMPGAVHPFERLRARKRRLEGVSLEAPIPEDALYVPDDLDLLFPSDHRKAFNRLLVDRDLKFDREGKPRTAYSLRHTYICFRLMEGADIYQIAKNCRTSVEMIEKYYASHIRTFIRTEAVNTRAPRKGKKRGGGSAADDHAGSMEG